MELPNKAKKKQESSFKRKEGKVFVPHIMIQSGNVEQEEARGKMLKSVLSQQGIDPPFHDYYLNHPKVNSGAPSLTPGTYVDKIQENDEDGNFKKSKK